MKEKISLRQICFILFVYTVATRLLIYPGTLTNYCGRDLLFPAAFDFLIQGVVIWAVAYLCSRTDKTFFQLLKDTLGSVTARIIMGFFAAIFILSAIVPLFEQKQYVHAIFYDTVPSLLVFLPFFVFALYVGGKSFANIGRCADVCFPLFIISMATIVIMSVGEVQLSALLPVGKSGADKIFGGALGSSYRFIEPCYLLMFMGRFKYKKGDAAKITLSYAAGAVFVIAFLAIFYGIYADIALSRQFAISKIALFFPSAEIVGRVDLIAQYVLEIVMLFAVVLNIQLAVYCIGECSDYKNSAVLSLAVNAVLATIIITCDHQFFGIQQFFTDWMWIAFIPFITVIPLCAWALRRNR